MIAAINREAGIVLTETGRILPIVTWIDAQGEETADQVEAVTCVAGAADEWFAITLADYETATTH